MSVRRCQREVSSREFAEWIAFYRLEAEAADPDREPDEDELAAKFDAFIAAHKAR